MGVWAGGRQDGKYHHALKFVYMKLSYKNKKINRLEQEDSSTCSKGCMQSVFPLLITSVKHLLWPDCCDSIHSSNIYTLAKRLIPRHSSETEEQK